VNELIHYFTAQVVRHIAAICSAWSSSKHGIVKV
jgi:hypothetical protein